MVLECQVELPGYVETQALIDFLLEIDTDFVPPLSSKVSFDQYAVKLQSNATFCVAHERGSSKIVGLVAFYCNDPQRINAYIPVVGVSKFNRGKGMGKKLLGKVLAYVRERGFENILLQTWEGNQAQSFYESQGFKIVEKVPGRQPDLCSLVMRKDLNSGC